MDSGQILERLRAFRLFQGLPDELVLTLAQKITVHDVPAREVIFSQGDAGEKAMAVFLVAGGRVMERRTDHAGREIFRRIVREGQAFGFRSVLAGGVQLSTAEAIESCKLFRLSAADFIHLRAQYPELAERLVQPAVAHRLRAMPLLGNLTDEQVRWMTDLFDRRTAGPGDVIFTPGQPEMALCLVDRGQVAVHGKATGHLILTAGHHFGRHPALGTRRATTASAVTSVVLYCLTPSDFEWLLSTFPGIRKVLERPPDISRRLGGVKLFARLTQDELAALAGYVCWEHSPAHWTVTQQGEPGEAFYILDHGEAIVRAMDEQGQQRPYDFLTPGRFFGETSLILQEPRDATVEAVTPADWLVLHHGDFMHFLETHRDIGQRLELREETRTKLEQRDKARVEQEEPVIFRSRRHWWPLVNNIGLSVLVFLLLSLAFAVGLQQHVGALVEEIIGALALITLLYIAWKAIDWSNDWLIVTTRRIIHQERVLLIWETQDEALLENIQDTRVSRSLLANLLGYGTLVVQTAATVGGIEFRFLPNPETAQQRIREQRARARAGTEAERHEQLRHEMEERLGLRLLPRPSHSAISLEPTPTLSPRPQERRFRPRLRLFSLREESADRTVWRKHWLNLLARISQPLALVILLGIGTGLVWQFWGSLQKVGGGASAVLVGILLWFGALFWLWWEYEDWHNDLYIVTRDRIIDLEKKPLFFAEEQREATLDKIQNVTISRPSPLAFIFGFGDVTIQTAAEVGAFHFKFVPNPREVRAEISRRVEAFRAEQINQDRARQRADMTTWFETYHRLQREQSS